ncbi:MAG: DinB family protein [Chloroflexi bacterium]|nr:MAG: DinB family protein [Chloroflexota bacterium]
MKIDFDAFFAGQANFADMVLDIQHADLYRLTDELFDGFASELAKATDAAVLFVPHDPVASDDREQGWTLNHVVTHLTASLEESSTVAALLARGVQVKERLRLEMPWQQLSTVQLVQARLRECHRMCRAFLDAWPDEPKLDMTVTLIPRFGPLNAIGLYMLGVGHGQRHLDQVRDTLRQYALSVGR